MDRKYIEAHQIVERYLQGKLTPEEQQAFEEAYLGDFELVEQLEQAERLQRGLVELTGLSEEQRHRARRPRLSPAHWPSLRSHRYSTAASVLLLLSSSLSVALYRENLALRDADSRVAGTRITRIEPLISFRSSDANVILPGTAEEWVVLLVDPGIVEYQRFRATLIRRDRGLVETVWRVSDIEQSDGYYLAVGLPGRLLGRGTYEVAVEGKMVEWPADRDFDRVTSVPLRAEPIP